MPYAGPKRELPPSKPAESSRVLLLWTAVLLFAVLLLRSEPLSGLDRFGLSLGAFDPARWIGTLLRLSNLLLLFLLRAHLSFVRYRRDTPNDLASFAQGVSLLVASLLFFVGFAGVVENLGDNMDPERRKGLYLLWAIVAIGSVVRAILKLLRHRAAWAAYGKSVFRLAALQGFLRKNWKIVKCASCGGENRLGLAHCQYCDGPLLGALPNAPPSAPPPDGK